MVAHGAEPPTHDPGAQPWRRRAAALIEMVRDLDPAKQPAHALPLDAAVSSRHLDLFRRYVADLREAEVWAEAWWANLVDTEMLRTPDDEMARENVRGRWPLGPAPTAKVVAVVREYWLRCERLNDEVGELERIRPETFMLQWLMDGHHEELAKFLCGFPHWPMGMDADGNWV